MSLLEVRDLCVSFRTRKGVVRAVDGVDFSLGEGKTLAIVGESGSGKTVTSTSILRLLDDNANIETGEIFFTDGGERLDLTKLPLDRLQKIRGNRISMIFQEPMTALNPVLSIGKQMIEPICLHLNMPKERAWEEGIRLLREVHIPNPERVMCEYAHHLSGGMRQRVMIAMALSCSPKILIADEPTTALDVTVQAQILRLMQELQRRNHTSILFITHDLGVVNEMADEVAVMYCGKIVERVPASRIFSNSRFLHPYTEGLMASLPNGKKSGERLECIVGNVPSVYERLKGCRFASRCKYCQKRCVEEEPALFLLDDKHFARCFYPYREDRGKVFLGGEK